MIFTRPTVIRTLVVGLAIVVAVVEPTMDAKEMTGCTLSATEFDICLYFIDRVIEAFA
jgi:hypothetical protein